uniref:Uncharacterized protein n=1 Tax=Anguilla anguilla TaxID=7936 RepID=A0A0E9P7R1_ANGAN
MLFLEAKTRVESFQRTISVQLVKRLKRYRHVNLFGSYSATNWQTGTKTCMLIHGR